ncbi:hypothetical protein QR98_0001850 [Sarcoptes scabiei]|uniref:YEATS domain-containing protein n=1 Tax=Sarcoptes scabiei TaxID=52283 RepID=A0A131ZU08_SARSC|nr:hypothetical protein QR98_0001850 [Sarcoptes scabiei]
MPDSSECVEVQLEIGHVAKPKSKKTPEGYTHDWTVFVRGVENSNIHSFVEKVIFHLHESFPKPKRGLCSSSKSLHMKSVNQGTPVLNYRSKSISATDMNLRKFVSSMISSSNY